MLAKRSPRRTRMPRPPSGRESPAPAYPAEKGRLQPKMPARSRRHAASGRDPTTRVRFWRGRDESIAARGSVSSKRTEGLFVDHLSSMPDSARSGAAGGEMRCRERAPAARAMPRARMAAPMAKIILCLSKTPR